MLRYNTKNYIQSEKEVIIEIEEEHHNTLLHGLNITVEDFDSKDLLINLSLSYEQVIDLYKMLTEKMCTTQMQMLDIIKNKK